MELLNSKCEGKRGGSQSPYQKCLKQHWSFQKQQARQEGQILLIEGDNTLQFQERKAFKSRIPQSHEQELNPSYKRKNFRLQVLPDGDRRPDQRHPSKRFKRLLTRPKFAHEYHAKQEEHHKTSLKNHRLQNESEQPSKDQTFLQEFNRRKTKPPGLLQLVNRGSPLIPAKQNGLHRVEASRSQQHASKHRHYNPAKNNTNKNITADPSSNISG